MYATWVISVLVRLLAVILNSRRLLFSFSGRVGRNVYWRALGFDVMWGAVVSAIVAGIIEDATLDSGASEFAYRVWLLALITPGVD